MPHPKNPWPLTLLLWAACTGAATHCPPWLTSRSAATRTASARRSWSRIVTVTFMRSVGARGFTYQSVTITPPFESVWSRGMKLSVSSAAFHK